MVIKEVPVGELKEYGNNPRKNANAVDKVAESIRMFGFNQPIVADKHGVIIAGHTRYKAAVKIGLLKVPVLYASDLNDAQAKAYRLADNKTAEFAEWDMDLLAGELDDLMEMDFDMQTFGFEAGYEEIIDDSFDVDGVLEEIEEPVSRRGDVWQLGRHRLMCGDATSAEDVRSLIGW